jgi:hypothetical protein
VKDSSAILVWLDSIASVCGSGSKYEVKPKLRLGFECVLLTQCKYHEQN